MKGTIPTSSAGTGSIRGRAALAGSVPGLSSGSGWFAQIGTLSGTSAGTSVVAEVPRTGLDILSTITLIAEYESAIH